MINLKYPIVLVHGMLVKDLFFWRAFRGIKGYLQSVGVKVYVANHDGLGSIENNAEQLKAEIERYIQEQGVEKVNIIAHSKGGLDARYMISKLGMSDKVASLTTLSTPHYGSKISRKVLKMPSFMASVICFFTNLTYRVLGDKKPDLLTLAHQLKDTQMHAFNRDVLNCKNVYYQSYSSSVSGKRQFLMAIQCKLAKYLEDEETDGIVSNSSSRWGNYCGDMSENTNHMQMVGIYYGSKGKRQEVFAFYHMLAEELAELGF